MTVRFYDLTNLQYSHVLYDSFLTEKYRTVITRWRLSCHSLRIETGRYQRPRLPRNERTCIICNTLEDEHHALFQCSAHIYIRLRYVTILSAYNSVQTILCPNSIEDASTIGRYILEIEKNMESLKMVFKCWSKTLWIWIVSNGFSHPCYEITTMSIKPMVSSMM